MCAGLSVHVGRIGLRFGLCCVLFVCLFERRVGSVLIMYSSLFTAGLQRAELKQEEKVLFPMVSNHAPRCNVNRAPIPVQQRLQVPSNPALTFSPSRRGRFAQFFPRRKIRSSFTSSTVSPLAGIKTPIKAAEVAARMQNMLLSPSRQQQHRSMLAMTSTELPDMSGAPVKPKASSR